MLARCRRIECAVENALAEQYATLKDLLRRGRNTTFGRRYGLQSVHNAEQFVSRIERFDYDSFGEFIDRMRAGERDVTCRGRVNMFAISSGSTSPSKYIPVTRRAMRENHLRGMADVVSLYLLSNSSSRLFEGRTLTMGGACRVERGALVGDLSALTLSAAGCWTNGVRSPNLRTALMEDFNAKCEVICRECVAQDIVAVAGVPSWTMALLRRVLTHTHETCIKRVWQNMELFMHGGVSFHPYKKAFEQTMGGGVNYLESYNASEGFIAIAEQCGTDEMLLMPHYGCYYEFARGNDVVPLEGVRTGLDYSLIMTSVNGLWRYELGDVVRFSSTNPYRLRVVGRTRQYINAFGEELMECNAEQALVRGSKTTGAVVEEYVISPTFGADGGGYHRWVVEFARPPHDVAQFAAELDRVLRELNSDYDAKRRSVMSPLKVEIVPRGTFHGWQSVTSRRKVPHMSRDGELSEDILRYARRLTDLSKEEIKIT